MLEVTRQPASRADLSKGLARIVAVCVPRKADEFEGRAWMAVMLDVLGQYPGDGILDAMARWVHKSKWLPTPADLIEDAAELTRWRENLTYLIKSAAYDHQLGPV